MPLSITLQPLPSDGPGKFPEAFLRNESCDSESRLFSGVLFDYLWFLGSYDITIKPKKYLRFSQGSLNSLGLESRKMKDT